MRNFLYDPIGPLSLVLVFRYSLRAVICRFRGPIALRFNKPLVFLLTSGARERCSIDFHQSLERCAVQDRDLVGSGSIIILDALAIVVMRHGFDGCAIGGGPPLHDRHDVDGAVGLACGCDNHGKQCDCSRTKRHGSFEEFRHSSGSVECIL